ncbi:hypothetical protein DKX38_013037 [Salix brachista]|uniref:Pentacotripeptide-repeat region of PRORP domain-containing protein n=1 Tax=Salix brachista TaxID=2182728 RepID=A0A5N5LQ39_9ROSI|nr:hypothetical protein DKX38_013037 [Salix brachista]
MPISSAVFTSFFDLPFQSHGVVLVKFKEKIETFESGGRRNRVREGDVDRKKIVFRFFMRAGHQENYSQEPCACNEMIEIRQEEEDKGQVQSEINAFNLLDALCECSLIKDADVLFKTVKNKVKPGANTYNVLFFRCCRVRNPTREMKVLKEMIQLGLPPVVLHALLPLLHFAEQGR